MISTQPGRAWLGQSVHEDSNAGTVNDVFSMAEEHVIANMFETILIPVDGSDTAKRAATVGREFAQRYDARLEVLHVLEDQSRLPGKGGDQDPEEKGREILDEIVELVAGSDVEIETHLVEGQPHEAITEHAIEIDSDLIVMGRHGRGGLRERLLGTVTDRVLRHTSIPVLTVPGEVNEHTTGGTYENILITTDGSENAERAADRPQRAGQRPRGLTVSLLRSTSELLVRRRGGWRAHLHGERHDGEATRCTCPADEYRPESTKGIACFTNRAFRGTFVPCN